MEKLSLETEKIMSERFGKDNVIALATTENNIPYVRNVNAFMRTRLSTLSLMPFPIK